MSTITLTTKTVASSFPQQLLHMPVNNSTLAQLMGRINALRDTQQTAASATTYHGATHAGQLLHVRVWINVAEASGESMIFDVQLNGTTVLKNTITLDSTSAAGYYDVSGQIVAGTFISPGDTLTVVRTYTAGGGPAAPKSEVTVEWGVQ